MKLTPAIIAFAEAHASADVRTLALQASRYPDIDMPTAIRQIAGRQIAKEKIPAWYAVNSILYPKHLSLEQCSSEHTARYKAALCSGVDMVDLTGGLGVDFSFMSRQFEKATYVEQQPELVEVAIHNFEQLAFTNVSAINTDAQTYLETMQPVDLIFIDPARRSAAGRKTVLIEDCTPNIVEIESLLEEKSDRIMVKLSPMLDISLALKSLRHVSDIHIVSSGNECKELLFIKTKNAGQVYLHCVNIVGDRVDKFSFTRQEEEQAVIDYTSQPGKYLYEPNASITKGGAYKSIAKRFSLSKLHISSHLYTSDVLHTDFHGRQFEVVYVSSFNKKDLKKSLGNITQANITTRNFPLSVDEIRKRTKLKDGGDVYIFATTLCDDKKVLIFCQKI